MFKKNKKTPILFKKFQDDQLLEKKMATLREMEGNIDRNEVDVKEKVIKERKKEKSNENKITYLNMGLFTKITVAVTNINSSVTGSQSVVLLLANYFAKMKKKVCIVTSRPLMKSTYRDFEVITREELYDSYDFYQVIIYDFGNYQSLDNESLNELKRCLVKLMITQYQTELMEDMASFIMSQSDIKRWIFYFIYVPEKQRKDVDAYMEDYKYYVLPLFSPSEIEKSLKKIIEETFKIYEVLGIGGL